MEKEKQSSLAYYGKIASTPTLGLFGILKEAFKVSIRNGRILFFIAFIMALYFTVMGVADRLILLPIAEDVVADSKLMPQNGSYADADPTLYKALLKDIRRFLTYLFVAASLLGLMLVFSATASVHSTFEAYTAKVLSLKDMLLGIRGRWKRALTVSIWMAIFSLASAALFCFVFGLASVMAEAEGSTSSTLNWGMLIVAVCYGVYVCTVWMLGVVVAVIEDDMSGLKAITYASEMMKGKKLKGFFLMAILMVTAGVISTAFSYLPTVSSDQNIKLALSVPQNLAYCWLKLFVFVVFTMFYHECKKEKIAEENRALYVPIAAAAEF